jgi:hypothetical protein
MVKLILNQKANNFFQIVDATILDETILFKPYEHIRFFLVHITQPDPIVAERHA